MVSAEGGDTLRASDKIRMLLYLINRGTDLPIQYQEQFRDLIKLDRFLIDFPYLFTEIRNSYVHSSLKKREKISRLPTAYLDTILTCTILRRVAYFIFVRVRRKSSSTHFYKHMERWG